MGIKHSFIPFSSKLRRNTSVLEYKNVPNENIKNDNPPAKIKGKSNIFKKILVSFIDRNSTVHKIWFFIVFLDILYQVFLIPLRFGYFEEEHFSWLIIESFLDLILGVDMIFRAFTPYYEREKLIFDYKKTIKHYLVKSFFFDLFAILPFWVFTWLVNDYFTFKFFNFPITPSWLKLNRLVFIFRLNYYFKEVEDFVVKSVLKFNPALIRVVKFLAYVFIIAHYSSCVWYLLIRFEVIFNKEAEVRLWSMSDALLHADSDTVFKYSLGLYWSIVTMTGYGGTMPITDIQTIFSIIIVFIGVAVYVTIIGILGSLITHLDTAATAYQEKIDTVNDYMKYRKLETSLQKSVRSYYNYLWTSRKGLDENKIFVDLPKYLRVKVASFLNLERFKEFHMFKDIEEESFLREILVRLIPSVSYPSSYIIRQGEHGHEMYFLAKGSADVVLQTKLGNGVTHETVFVTLKSGSIFGEIALIKKVKRTASIRAKEFCELFILKKEDFDEILKSYPEEAAKIIIEGEKRHKTTKEEKKQQKKDKEDENKRMEEERKKEEEREKKEEEERLLLEKHQAFKKRTSTKRRKRKSQIHINPNIKKKEGVISKEV